VSGAAVQVHRPASTAEALRLLATLPQARVIGGGTDLVPLARDGLQPLGPLVSLRSLGLSRIEQCGDRLLIGAGATLAEVMVSPLVQREAPAVVQALRDSASPQVRNAATVAGNLLQRSRCPCFRGGAPACNRRVAGSGCAARGVDGGGAGSGGGSGAGGAEQRHAALFGTSVQCIAAHASDLAVALLALEAQVAVSGPQGERMLALEALYPATASAEREHMLAPGELVTAVRIPIGLAARMSGYRKVRDRASFQFALVSLAWAVDRDHGRLRRVRLAAGGVGTRPWRLRDSEAVLEGAADDASSWRRAAEVAGQGAQALPGNAFKLELLRRCVLHAGGGGEPA
jgi:xanthine dehydrogenase YagS FAD-binding subunit